MLTVSRKMTECNKLLLHILTSNLIFHFQHIVQIHLNIYPICQQLSECPVQTMLAAVQATNERLIVPRYLMHISARLVFSLLAHNDGIACHHTLVTFLLGTVVQSYLLTYSECECIVDGLFVFL